MIKMMKIIKMAYNQYLHQELPYDKIIENMIK